MADGKWEYFELRHPTKPPLLVRLAPESLRAEYLDDTHGWVRNDAYYDYVHLNGYGAPVSAPATPDRIVRMDPVLEYLDRLERSNPDPVLRRRMTRLRKERIAKLNETEWGNG